MTAMLLGALPPTHLTQRDADVLARLAANLRPEGVAVEIGSYLGASSLCIARNFQAPGCRLFCVDTWTNIGMTEGPRDTYAEFLANTKAFRSTVQPIRLESIAAAKQFESPVDLLFIDGDHSLEGCRRDIVEWVPKVRHGGIVALHDFAWADGVREAIRDFLWSVQTGSGHWEGNIYWTRIQPQPPSLAKRKPVIAASMIVPTGGKDRTFQPDTLDLRERSNASELLVVYTGSEKDSSDRDPFPGIRVCHEPVPGLLAGRHRGFHEASGEVLLYLDDDVRLERGWLNSMLEPFADPSVHLVGCRYLPEYESEPPEWLAALWSTDAHGRHLGSLSLLDYGKVTMEVDPVMIWGLCYAIRKETLRKLGGFHPDGYPWEMRRFRGDGETAPSILARQLKLKAIYQGKTAVYHQVPNSRMTPEYFERRAHLQGISDSYAKIRADGLVQAPPPSWKQTLRGAKQLVRRIRTTLTTKASPPGVQERITRAYQQGFDFHQKAVRRDPALLSWVLREEYWDFRPNGVR